MVHLQKKGAYENVPFKVKFNMLERENIKPFIRRAKPWLLQGRTLFSQMTRCIGRLSMLKWGHHN